MDNINIKFDNGNFEVQILPDVFVIIRNKGKEYFIKWENLLPPELERIEKYLQYLESGKDLITQIIDGHSVPNTPRFNNVGNTLN